METSTIDQDLPIALRRTKRKADAISPVKTATSNNTTVSTPSRARGSKKVRFSDPTPLSTSAKPSNATTGLTPAVAKSHLHTPKSKRPATPARAVSAPLSSSPSGFDLVQFTPLRQALDERCRRRIRRNHLSEEVSDYEADKRDNAVLRKKIEVKDAELKRLKHELREARQSKPAQQMSEDQLAASQTQVDEVEQELSALRRSFDEVNNKNHPDDTWSHIPLSEQIRQNSEGGDTIQIFEDENDGYQQQEEDMNPVPPSDQVDVTLMGAEIESARQYKQTMLSSFSRNRSFDADLSFADSPARPQLQPSKAPATPHSLQHDLQKQLRAANAQVDEVQLALSSLENEVRALGFSTADAPVSECVQEIADQFREIRLELERLMPGETVAGFENHKLLPELVNKIKGLMTQLHNREGELRSMRDQERSLRGSFDHTLLAMHTADSRIRDLEASLDKMAEEGMDVRMRAQSLERERDEKIADVSKLSSALTKLDAEKIKLETLIMSVEDEHRTAMASLQSTSRSFQDRAEIAEAKVSAEETGRRKAEESAVARLATIQDLEVQLATNKTNAEKLERDLKTLQQQHTSRDKEASGFTARISSLSAALTSANAEITKLQTLNTKLEERYRREVITSADAIEKLQHVMYKAASKVIDTGKNFRRSSKVRLANWELESDPLDVDEDGLPLTPASVVRFVEEDESDGMEGDSSSVTAVEDDHSDGGSESVPGSVEAGRGKKRMPLTPAQQLGKRGRGRRRYDSGIGMGSLSEGEESDVEDSGFVMTPEMSDEMGGGEMEVEV